MVRYSKKNKNKRDRSAGSNSKGDNMRSNPRSRTTTPRVKEMRNDRMVSYYTYQGVFGHGIEGSKEKDREDFVETSCKPLNASFRVTKLAPEHFRKSFDERMKVLMSGEMEIVLDTPNGKVKRKVNPAARIPFVENGWKLDVDRNTIRKNNRLKDFLEFLKVETDTGRITRQETVSMVPPVALDVKPDHLVLDLCAAPGSKTGQILETVSMGKGWVCANDVNVQRAHMLTHQCKRINSPHLLVTNHLGQEMPMPRTFRNDGRGEEGWADRVLCDVPCTGDGTMRKNPGIFKNWSASQQVNIHKLQLEITMRGIRHCKVGGLVVYSTCSMSPMENEAVVAQIIRDTDGAVEVEECRELREKGFRCREGMTTWKVMDDRIATRRHFGEVVEDKRGKREKRGEEKKGQEKKEEEKKAENDGENRPSKRAKMDEGKKGHELTGRQDKVPDLSRGKMSEDGLYVIPTYDDSEESWGEKKMIEECNKQGLWEFKEYSDVPSHLWASIPKGVFPPTEEETKVMGLEKCMRIMPQDMDTGGFFVTILRKKRAIGSVKLKQKEGEKEGEEEEEAFKSTMSIPSKLPRDDNGNGGAVVEAAADDEDKARVNFGGPPKPPPRNNQEVIPLEKDLIERLTDFYGLEKAPVECFFARTESAKGIMYIHPPILSHLNLDLSKKTRMVHSGVQVMEKNSKNRSLVEFRLHQDGINYTAPFMTKRKLKITNEDFCKVVKCAMECKEHQLASLMFEDGLRGAVEELPHGCFVVELEGTGGMETVYMTMWKNNNQHGLHSLVSKLDLKGTKSKLQGEGRWVEMEIKKEWLESKGKNDIQRQEREKKKKEREEKEANEGEVSNMEEEKA